MSSADDNEYPPRKLPSLNGDGEEHAVSEELPLPGVERIMHELKDPVEVELRLLRQAYKEHGMAIGQMQATFERNMEALMDKIDGVRREVQKIQLSCRACDVGK